MSTAHSEMATTSLFALNTLASMSHRLSTSGIVHLDNSTSVKKITPYRSVRGGLFLAERVGLEPTTIRLTVERSTIELPFIGLECRGFSVSGLRRLVTPDTLYACARPASHHFTLFVRYFIVVVVLRRYCR